MSTLLHDASPTKPGRVIRLVARRRCIECDQPLPGLTSPRTCQVCREAKLCRIFLETLIDEADGVLVHAAAEWLERIHVDRRIFLNPHARQVLEEGVDAAARVLWTYGGPSIVRTAGEPASPIDDVDEIPF